MDHSQRNDRGRREDRGLVLIPTLILTLVMSVTVIAVLGYVTAGLKSSRVTTERTEDASAAAAAIYWVIEDLSNGSGNCEPSQDAPAAAMPQRVAVPVSCTFVVDVDSDIDRFQLVAQSSTNNAGRVTALVEYRPLDAPTERAVRIYSWEEGTAASSGPLTP